MKRPVAERATPVVGITPMEAQRLKKKWKSEQSYAWMGTVVKMLVGLTVVGFCIMRAFQPHPGQERTDVSVILLGLGNVGRAFLRQVVEGRDAHRQGFHVAIQIEAITDTSGVAVPARGIWFSDTAIHTILRLKEAGHSLREMSAATGPTQPSLLMMQAQPRPAINKAHHAQTLLVDLTSSTDTTSSLLEARGKGVPLVLANKHPITGDMAMFQTLTGVHQAGKAGSSKGAESVPSFASTQFGDPRVLGYESTVGAALPLVGTLRGLLTSLDVVESIEGAFSGTLGFILSRVQAGELMSQAIADAIRLGYAEADPREDLSGMDVARKALILARTAGWEFDMSDIKVSPMYSAELAALSKEEFLERSTELDNYFARLATDAKASGEVLRYVATVKEEAIRVGLQRVPIKSALGALNGTDNMVAFTTGRYPSPLIVQGAGAGAEVTAAGVMSDILALCIR